MHENVIARSNPKPSQKKTPLHRVQGGFTLNRELTMTYSHMGEPTLPLAQ